VFLTQAIESGDAIEVKYTGSFWTNNTFGKVLCAVQLEVLARMSVGFIYK
jgi:hypothetical protein